MNVEQFKQMVQGVARRNIKNDNKLKRFEQFNNPYCATTNNIPSRLADADNDGSNAVGRWLDFVVFNKAQNTDNTLQDEIVHNIEFNMYMILMAYYFDEVPREAGLFKWDRPPKTGGAG